MDPNHQNHQGQEFHMLQQQLQQQHQHLAHPQQPSQQPQIPPPPQLQMQMAQQQQQQQQQHLGSTSQAEAVCRSLQFLLDSGMSKALLHQWVNDLPPQLQQAPAQSLAPAPSPTSSLAPSPLSTPLLAPAGFHSPTLQQSPSSGHLPNMAHSPMAPPTPGPPPLATSAIDVSPAVVATAPAIVIKSEPFGEEFEKSYFDQASDTWTPSLPHAPAQVPSAPVPTIHPIAAHDPVFHLPQRRSLHHGPRISISSTSSASSGHASIWSSNSAHSSSRSSWHSMASSRSMPSLMTPTSSASLMNGSQSAAASKQNIYWCTSCDTSFKRKYDWKRHEDEFHERWRKYPCPEPGCNRCFWGSNSFNQHHKQSHSCKECPHADKVVKYLRKRKYWACGFCSALHPARERHVEHVARHFESGLTKSDWLHSRVIYGLLHQPLIHDAWNALVASKHGKGNTRRPQFSWNPIKTGRASGFIENESEGQLQDLLEFFDSDESGAEWIVGVAYGLTDIVLATPPLPPLPPPLAPSSAAASAAVALPQQLLPRNMMPAESFSQQQQDHRIAFPPLLSQVPQQGMLASPVSATFSSSPYPVNSFLIPLPESATMQQPSPDPSVHSPMIPSQTHLEKRELPPIPSEADSSVTGNGGNMMDFEYSSAPMMYKEEPFASNATMADNLQQHQEHYQQQYQQQYHQQFQQQQQQQQPQQQQQQQYQQHQQLLPPDQTPQADWGTCYFNDANGSL